MEVAELSPSKHKWSFQDNWMVYTMYRMNIFRGYKNSHLEDIIEWSGMSARTINMAYKNLEYLDGLKGLCNPSKAMIQIHQEQRNTSLRTLVGMIHNSEIRDKLLGLLRSDVSDFE